MLIECVLDCNVGYRAIKLRQCETIEQQTLQTGFHATLLQEARLAAGHAMDVVPKILKVAREPRESRARPHQQLLSDRGKILITRAHT